MRHAHLPSRRDEAWRWSDLRAAVNEIGAPEVAPIGEGHIAERLARGMIALGPNDQLDFETLSIGDRETMVEDIEVEAGFASQSFAIAVEPGACVTRIIRQRPVEPAERDGVGVFHTRVRVAAGGQFRQFVLAEGARLARIETHVSVEGEGAEVELNGVYLCGPGRHADLTSTVEHKAPGGKTNQLVRGVAREGGRGVFQGKIVVEKGAQRTDARQHHKGMLLEDGAEIFAKPELMIYADEVQCAHGNTAGGLDESALFYLRARGVPEAEARALLTEAFLLEAVPDWLPADVRAEVEARIGAWLRT